MMAMRDLLELLQLIGPRRVASAHRRPLPYSRLLRLCRGGPPTFHLVAIEAVGGGLVPVASLRVDGGDTRSWATLGAIRQLPGRWPGSTSWPATSASSATASACSASNPGSTTAANSASASLTSPDTSACLASRSSQAHSG